MMALQNDNEAALRTLVGLLLSLLIPLAFAKDGVPLPADQAFAFSIMQSSKDQLILNWSIAPGYYLYRDRLSVLLAPTSMGKINRVTLPPGEIRHDAIRGTYQAYTRKLQIPIPLTGLPPARSIMISYQGCSIKGFCYGPVKKYIDLDSPAPSALSMDKRATAFSISNAISQQDYAKKVFNQHNLLIVVLIFFGIGLLLSFTPCVLPMVPILSGIIMGQRHPLTTSKAFLLSFAYVLGMAATYALAGTLIALLGSHVQTEMQRPWIIIVFSLLFVWLAFSLFGFYGLRLPARWQQGLAALSFRQKGGTYVGVFLMGGISSLIVSPCVSAPLVGVLAYIAQTGNLILGALALLALGFGMGAPLLLLGVSAGGLLPKAGAWMVALERAMGVFLLAFAIWLLSRILPGPFILFLWGSLCIFIAIYLKVFTRIATPKRHLQRGVGIFIFLYGMILVIGAIRGNSEVFYPWEKLALFSHGGPLPKLNYIEVNTPQRLQGEFDLAKKRQQPIMLDFYADWCVACITMERGVFNRRDVQTALAPFRVLRINITQNSPFDRTLMHQFNVVAPPTFLFFNSQGVEMSSARLIGETNATEFIMNLMKIPASKGPLSP